MKLVQAVAVTLLQLVVTGPIIVFFPFAVFLFLPMLPVSLFEENPQQMMKGLSYGLGGAGLLGLYVAILVPHRWLRRFSFVRWLTVAFITLGFVATALLLFLPEESGRLVDDLDAYRVWFLGGPVLTGAYNLWRLCRAGPGEPPALAASTG